MNKIQLLKNLIKCFCIIVGGAVVLFLTFYQIKNYIDWNNIYALVIAVLCISVVFIFWIVVVDFQYYKIKFHLRRYKKSKKTIQ